MNSLIRIWVRATGQQMGNSDTDLPQVPVLTRRELRIALALSTFWILMHFATCVFVMANVIRHW